MSSQREQYGSTVHLFIGTGCSLYKITPMSFTFANDSIVTHRGLNSLFLFTRDEMFLWVERNFLRFLGQYNESRIMLLQVTHLVSGTIIRGTLKAPNSQLVTPISIKLQRPDGHD
jgi:hypothetical protein